MITWGITTIFQEAQRVDHILTMKKKNKYLWTKRMMMKLWEKYKTLEIQKPSKYGMVLSESPIHNKDLD